MATTRTVARAAARKSDTTATVEALKTTSRKPKTFEVPLAPVTRVTDFDAPLRNATGAAMAGIEEAGSRIAALVLALRASIAAGKDKEHITTQMQLGALMASAAVDLAGAQVLLSASPRTDATTKTLNRLKTAKMRAYQVMAKEDEKAKAGDTSPTSARAAAPASRGAATRAMPASLMSKIDVPAPVNAPAFHAQLLKVRTLLKQIIEHGETLDGAEADLTIAMQALALLPTK